MNEKKRILQERAEQLARRPEPEEEEQERIEVLEFSMGSERYAVEVAAVHGVVPLQQHAPVPCTPAFAFGIMNLRGRIVSLVDLRQFFDLPGTNVTPQTMVIVLRDPAMEFGILADTVHTTRSIPKETILPPQRDPGGAGSDFVLGATADGIILLDGSRILSDTRIRVQEEVNP